MTRYLNICIDDLNLHTLIFFFKCLFSIISSNTYVQMIFYKNKKKKRGGKAHSESDI